MEISTVDFIARIERELRDHKKEMKEHCSEMKVVSESIIKLEAQGKANDRLLHQILEKLNNLEFKFEKSREAGNAKIEELKKRQNKIVTWLAFGAGALYMVFGKGASFLQKIL